MATRGVRLARSLCLATVAVLALLAARPASAYRPFDGTDAHVAEHRLFELEMSPIAYARMGLERSLIAPQVTFNYGAGAGYEFVLEGASVMLMNPEPEGVSPTLEQAGCSLKKVLRPGVLQKRKGPSIATEESIDFPSRGQAHAGFGASLIVSQPFSPAVSMLHFNAALERTPDQQTNRFAGMILEGPESWPIRPVAELSWAREGSAGGVRGYLAGIIWQTRQGLTMDAAIKAIDGGPMHGFEVRSGFTWHMQIRKRA